MQLENSFTVPVNIEKAWEVLLDIERVAPCMPGAALDSIDGDSFTGRVKIKLGPVNLTYKGDASFLEKDAAAHRVVIKGTGKDARGNGTAAAHVTATLHADGEDSTRVEVITDLNITGKPAQFGRGVMVDVGNKLIGQFATCLEGKLTGEPEVVETVEPVADASVPTATDPAAAGAPEQQDAPLAPGPLSGSPVGDTSVPTTPPAAESTPAAPAAPPAPRVIRQPAAEPEPIDLLELAGGSVLTRAVPAAGGLLALVLLVVFLLRRRRS